MFEITNDTVTSMTIDMICQPYFACFDRAEAIASAHDMAKWNPNGKTSVYCCDSGQVIFTIDAEPLSIDITV